MIVIDQSKCVGCAYCAMVCPESSFKVNGLSRFNGSCIGCKKCVNYCPMSAITLK